MLQRGGMVCLLGLLLSLVCFGCAEPESAASATEPQAAADAAPAAGEEPSKEPPRWIKDALVQPRGVLRNEPDAAPGYVLFAQLTSDTSYLVDRDGQVVHSWSTPLAADAGYLLDDGSLLRQARIAEPENFRAGGVSGYLQRVSWDGEVLWQWRMGDTERILHHDLVLLPNGNILVIAWELITAEQARAAGRRPELIPAQGLWADWLLEVEPLPPDGARIVWEWHVWDHLVQNHDASAPGYGDPAAFPRRLDVNSDAAGPVIDAQELEQLKALGYVPDTATEEDVQSDFLHMNSVDYRPGLDQIVVSVPEIGEIWVIDHSTTTEEARGAKGGRHGHGGDLLYRWGNPQVYGRGGDADQRLFYQHQVQWVPAGMPGAGHLTLFNNGGERGWSEVLELELPVVADGSYPLPDDRPWGPIQPVWSYAAPEPQSLYAPFISGVHRLANGNTFVCSGPQGRFLELTFDGRVVWEYRNPYHEAVPGWHPPGTEKVPYGVFRATKIPPDHPALRGRELRPLVPQPAPYELPAPGPTSSPATS